MGFVTVTNINSLLSNKWSKEVFEVSLFPFKFYFSCLLCSVIYFKFISVFRVAGGRDGVSGWWAESDKNSKEEIR